MRSSAHVSAPFGFTARLRTTLLVALILTPLVTVALSPDVVIAAHGGVTVSSGVYRIPYADGTEVGITRDHHTHSPLDRIDMSAGVGAEIVAAASGWIRAIVDHNGNSPGAGDGLDASETNPQDDALEHSCGNNPPDNTVAGDCSDYNNYVWIEHPNGEWTKYTHFGTGTVTDAVTASWAEDEWVNAGEVLGLEGDVGQASSTSGNPAYHLHFEVARPNTGRDLQFNELGGGITDAQNLVPFVCDIGAPNLYVEGATYTANPCVNEPPTADAGGPYVVDEGSTVQLDGTASADPDGNPLSYRWAPESHLDDRWIAQPTFTGVEDSFNLLSLTVYDQVEALGSPTALTSVIVQNVAPSVNAVADPIDEGGMTNVGALVTDPGPDIITATIDWDDGTPPEAVTVEQLFDGVSHVYGDNGTFDVEVTATDDDGGVGSDIVPVAVGNLDPTLSLDGSDAVSFPGGDYVVVEAGSQRPWLASGTDAGSDDLTFTWSTGDASTTFNDGQAPDPFPSPHGVFPFAASDQVDVGYDDPGVEGITVALTDDDGGTASGGAGVVVTGTATATQGGGWWKHQLAGTGAPQVDPGTIAGYLESVNAVSGIFSESVAAATTDDASEVLSPAAGDRRARATANLMVAWLELASGAVAWDATVPLSDGTSVAFLDLMAAAEEIILDASATGATLLAVEQDLARVRHAG